MPKVSARNETRSSLRRGGRGSVLCRTNETLRTQINREMDASGEAYTRGVRPAVQRYVLDSDRDNLGVSSSRKEDIEQLEQEVEEVRRALYDLEGDLEANDPPQSAPMEFLINTFEHSFTVLHGDALPPIPGRPPANDTKIRVRMIEPELLVGCYWSMNAIPYSGFIPREPFRTCFDDTLFSHLFRRKWDIPMEQTPGGNWKIPDAMLDQWDFLATVLTQLRVMLWKTINQRGSEQHLAAPLPSTYQYKLPLSNPVYLQKRLIRARAAFLVLGAEISYLYAPLHVARDVQKHFLSDLRSEFQDEVLVQQILHCWLFIPSAGFYKSSPGDGYGRPDGRTVVPRFGVFVNTATTTICRGFWHYECFHVPVWFHWGNRNSTFTPLDPYLLRRHGFHKDTVLKYLALDDRPIAELEAGKYFEPARLKPSYEMAPTKRVVQLVTGTSVFAPAPHESWSEFLLRRDKTIVAWKVSEEDATIIHQRQIDADTRGFIPTSRLFQWKRSWHGSRTGTSNDLVRVRVWDHKAMRVWGQYRPEQRVYCAVFDEWDVCEEFAKGSKDYCDLGMVGEACATGVDATLLRQMLEEPYPDAEVDFVSQPPMSSSESKEAVLEEVPVPEFEEGEIEDSGLGKFTAIAGKLDWTAIYRALYWVNLNLLQPRPIEVLTLNGVLSVIHGLTIPEFDVAVDAADLKLRCLRELSCSFGTFNCDFSSQRLQELGMYLSYLSSYANHEDAPIEDIGLPDCSDLNREHPSCVFASVQPLVKRVDYLYRDQLAYEIEWTEGSPNDVHLLLYRAADVVLYLRQRRCSSPEEVLLQLASAGIRFTIAISATGLRLERQLPPTPLPTRSFPFSAGLQDYQQYVQRRTALLSHTSVLRAALMAGGLYWRLAMEHTSSSAIVASGPGSLVEVTGQRYTLKNGEVLCEEALSDDQIDVICGVYEVWRTDQVDLAPQYVSWFPRHSAWRASGLNVGFWSQDAESWYQARVGGYLTGGKVPLKQVDWDRALRLNKGARRVARGLDVVCERELERAGILECSNRT